MSAIRESLFKLKLRIKRIQDKRFFNLFSTVFCQSTYEQNDNTFLDFYIKNLKFYWIKRDNIHKKERNT